MSEETCEGLSLEWTQKAEIEWERILTFYTVRNGLRTYSLKLDKELKKILASTCRSPKRGLKTKRRGVRRCSVARRFAVFYRIKKDAVEVVAVVDARRNIPLD